MPVSLHHQNGWEKKTFQRLGINKKILIFHRECNEQKWINTSARSLPLSVQIGVVVVFTK